MIYTIKYDGETIASSIGDATQTMYSAKLSLTSNNAGTLTFMLPFGHVSYNVPRPMEKIISVEQDGNEIWFGRVLSFKDDRLKNRAITCEGGLAFLDDISANRITVGEIAFSALAQYLTTNSLYQYTAGDNITLKITGSENTVKNVLENYIEENGGYFYVMRGATGDIILGYTKDGISDAEQEIRQGNNLIDISVSIDGSSLITKINASYSSDSGTVKQTYTKNTDIYGVCEKDFEYAVSTPAELEAAAKDDLEYYAVPQTILSVSALDNSYEDPDIPAIQLLQRCHVVCDSHNVDTKLIVTGLTIDLTGASETSINLGMRQKTLTEQTATR